MLSYLGVNVIPRLIKVGGADKVAAVVVKFEFFENGFVIRGEIEDIHICHRFKVSGVEARGEDGVTSASAIDLGGGLADIVFCGSSYHSLCVFLRCC